MKPLPIPFFLVSSVLAACAFAVEAAPVDQQPEVAPAPVVAPKPKTHRWVEGPLIRVYAIQASSDGNKATGWPPAGLPDAPLAVISDVTEFPNVPKAAAQKAGAEIGKPNRLLPLSVAPQLEGLLYYAVEYEGCVWAESAGKYGISVTSDDPTEVLWQPIADEGWKSLAKTSHSISLEKSEWNLNTTAWKYGLGTNYGVATTQLAKEIDTITAPISLTTDRTYVPIRIRAYQRWMPRPAEMAAQVNGVDQDALWCKYAGARLVVNFTTPDGQEELRLFRREKIKAAASSRPTEE